MRPPGCQAAELRVERIHSQVVRLHDARPETTADDTDFGMGVRVVSDGAVGFAATVDVRPEEAADLVRRAKEMARVTSRAGGGRVELAPEPAHGDVTWSSAFEIDPSTVSMADKIGLLAEWSERLGRHAAVSHTTATLLAVSEQTYLADLNGTRATQHRVRMQTQLEALALSDGGLRDHAHAGAAGRAGLGVPDRAGVGRELGLGRRAGAAARAAGREAEGALGPGRDLRPRHRPVEPVAHHPRVDRARHRARPGRRLRGGLRRDLLRDLRQARHTAPTAPPSCT